MRTKHLLTMAALTLGFAACTQEELVENVVSNPLERAALDNLTIEFPGTTADSRMIYDDAAFGWQWKAGDKFSAFLVDGATQWTVGDNLATNYIYSQGEDGSYSTTSQMVEGMYWFFAPAKEDKLDRGLISFELETNQPAGYYKSEASQVYFSPIYKLEAKNNAANVVLKPTVYNLYSQAIFHLKNVDPKDKNINILQIILEQVGTDKNFTVAGEISPVKVAEASSYKYSADDEAFVETVKNADLQNADVVAEGATTSKTIALECEETLEAGETLTATMLVPQMAESDLKVTIITDKGSITATVDGGGKAIEAPELEKVVFKHHGAKYIFGKLSGGAIKPLEITTDDIDTTPGYKYIASAEDLVALIDGNHGTLRIKKVGEWAINEAAINALNNNANVKLVFDDKMSVVNGGDEEVELKNMTFNADYTLDGGTVNTAVAPASVNAGTLKYTGSENLVNNGGEIIVNSGNVTSVVNNSGKVTFNANVTLSTLTNGSAEYHTVGEIVVNAGKKVNVTGEFTNIADIDANHNQVSTIEVNGTFEADEMTNNGKITNNGKLSGGTNNGEIYNKGEVEEIVNDGYIEMTDFDAEAYDITGTGLINNNKNGFVSANNNVVYYEADGKVEKLNTGVNLVIVNGGSLRETTVGVDVLVLGSVSVRGNLTIENADLYVGCKNATNGKYNNVAQRILGAWNTTDNKYSDVITDGTELKVGNEIDVRAVEIYNYGTVNNRGTVSGALKENSVWKGYAVNWTASKNVTLDALISAADGGVVILPSEGIELTEAYTVKSNVTIEGGSISGYPVYVDANKQVTFDGVTFKNPVNSNDNASSLYVANCNANVTVKNCVFEGFQWEAIQITPVASTTATISILNNTFKAPAAGKTAHRYLHIQANVTSGTNAKVIVKGNTFGEVENLTNSAIDIDYINKFGQVTVQGNSFADSKKVLSEGECIYVIRKGDSAPMDYGLAYDRFTSASETTLKH